MYLANVAVSIKVCKRFKLIFSISCCDKQVMVANKIQCACFVCSLLDVTSRASGGAGEDV